MANKVIKDSIRNSKSLARCSFIAELNFPRFLLLSDDWGCFEIDLETIRGYLYPKRLKKVTLSKIAKWLKEYEDNGMLFCWSNGERDFGYFVNYNNHSGEYLSRRHKRKTPEPPRKELTQYQELMNKKFNLVQKTSKHFKSSPNPNPNLNPIYIDVLNFWNSQEKLSHHKLKGEIGNNIKKAIDKRLNEEVTKKSIINAIKNYVKIVNGDEYYFNYRWTLSDFLRRGFEKFKNWDIARENYLKEEYRQQEKYEQTEHPRKKQKGVITDYEGNVIKKVEL